MNHQNWAQQVINAVVSFAMEPNCRRPSVFDAVRRVFTASPRLNDGPSVTGLRPYLPSFSGWSLRARLIGIVLALAVPLNLVIVAVVWRLAGAAQDAQRASLLYSARSVAAALDAELGKYLTLAMALSRSPALLSGDLSAFEQEARRTFEGVPDAWVLVADRDGQQLVNTVLATPQPLPQRPPAALEVQRRAFETAAAVISGIRVGPATQRWIATIDVPVFKDGLPYRALVVTMTMDGFLRLLNARDLPKNWLAGIIDGHGRYVARVPDHQRVVGQLASDGWRRTAGRNGLSEFLSRDGERVVNANDVSTLADWTVGIAIKKSQLSDAAWRETRWATLLGSLLSVLSLLFATHLARRFNHHLGELRTNAKELLASGAGSSKPPTVPELAEVWSTLQSAARDRDRSEERLRQSYQTYFRLIKNAAFGVYVVDADFRLAEVSTGAQKVFQNVRPLLGRNFGEVLRIIWPEPFAAQTIAIFRRTLETGEPYHSANTSEVRSDTADREAYDWRIERVALPDGRFGVVCYFYDLSDRLRHEEHVRLLMNELNHRSKNMIGIIQAIARRTKTGSVDDFVARFCQRLGALAANQDILVKTEWRGAELEELARAQLTTFTDRTSERITISGPSLVLNSNAAQAIGMALHELATNATKYGALSNERGRVEFRWTADGGRFRCTWVERDGPQVVVPSQHGFGTTVLDQMVRMSVDGAVKLDFATGGLSWCLECPLDNVRA
jgi:two-component sensor histidine kinase